jgi:eukaryotic-like serine/threonine-protein kinase
MTDQPKEKVCPQCRTANQVAELKSRDYRCAHCGLELAHLDTAANGAIRGLFGWLLDVGEVVNDRYRIAAVLGKGGFGVTYLVDDLRLHGKRRALKEIPELLFDEHETKLLGRLSHPAIPDITDRFTRGGMVYLVLEFGGSRTLRIEQERQGGRIPVFTLLPLIEQICGALTYLHAQDPPVVHRDLKPENILLDDNDRVMLIDFGIAKESSPDSATRTLGRAVTHGFSPPEQVLGTGTDARSDVYALGAILYGMLTGQTPTPAHERVTGKVLEPPSHFVPDIPPHLDAAVMQALELNINARQQSVEDLARALSLVQAGGGSARTVFAPSTAGMTAQVSTSSQVRLPSVHLPSSRPVSTASERADIRVGTAPPAPPKAKSRAPLIIAALALTAFAAGGAWLYLQRERSTPAAETAEAPSPASASTPVAGTAPTATTKQAGAPPGDQGAQPSGPAPAAVTSAPGQTSPAAAGVRQAPSTVPGSPASVQTPAGVGAPPRPVQAALPPTAPSSSAADLPSIFSGEQKPVTRRERDSGSLMDIFDKQRSLHLDEPAALPEPAPVAAEPTPQKQAVAAEPPPTRRTSKRRHSSPSSSWTINYQGARKTD